TVARDHATTQPDWVRVSESVVAVAATKMPKNTVPVASTAKRWRSNHVLNRADQPMLDTIGRSGGCARQPVVGPGRRAAWPLGMIGPPCREVPGPGILP